MIDWDAIEKNWRHTGKSNRALGREFEISEGAIRKRAKAEGWEKGEKAKPRQPAPKREKPFKPKASVEDKKPDEEPLGPMDQTVELAKRMLGELDVTSMMQDEIEDLINKETEDDRDPRRRNAMLKAVSLPTRALTLKTIQQTLAAALEKSAPGGKKEAKKEAAAEVSSTTSRFGARQPPRLVANNK